MERAFAYIRVSGQSQINGDGLIRQEETIRHYAETNGISIEKIFREEGVSGTKENREALAELMVSLEQNGHGIKNVIVERLDRLSRDLMVQEGIIRDFQKNGFNLISALEGADLLSNDPTRTFIRQVLGAVAELDKNMIVLKLRAARDRKRAKEGKCEGRKVFLESPEGQAVMKEIKRLRRKSKGTTKLMTYAEVAEELNRQGHKSSIRRPFNAQMVADLLR